MDVYASTLLASMIAAGIAALAALTTFTGRVPRGRRGAAVATTGRVALGLAVVLLAIAVTVHASEGHGPRSEAPMGVLGFLGAHPAVVVVALVAVAAAWPLWPRR